MIQVKNLTKRYGSLVAVDHVSFHVEEGEIVGFLGPNGAGKTTTLRILTCFQPADGGEARVAGYDVFAQSLQVRQLIGYLPENVPMYPEMRVREYLKFRAKLRGLPPAEIPGAIERVSQRCWVGEFINRPIGQLSKGMRQRVGLAETLLHDPKVLILDEPTVGLDPNQIRSTRELIRELGRHHTIIFSSHILPEVEAVCSRIVIIAGGRLVASGTPSELRGRLAAESKLIAEIRGPSADIRNAVGQIGGVHAVEVESSDGWNRLAIEVGGGKDIREQIFNVTAKQGWTLREMRNEVASLEDFFVKITAQQQDRNLAQSLSN